MRVLLRLKGRLPVFLSFKQLGISICLLAVCVAVSAQAAVVRGTVTDRLGAAVRGARVTLVQNGKIMSATQSGADGSYELLSADRGRFVVSAIGTGFSMAVSPEFYSGPLDVVNQNMVLKPASVNEDITVTATGVPTPQAQLSSSVSVIHGDDLVTRVGIVDDLRMMPGVNAVQTGQLGGATSLFVRGGPSTGNKVLIDGVPAGDMGGSFDFGTVSSTGIESVEVYRGPDSVLYGSDASGSVLNIQTPRGVTASPVLNYSGDGGNFNTYRNELTLSGTRNKLDYYVGGSRLDTSNALPNDKYHATTAVANLGYGTGAMQARFTVRYGASVSGLPGSYDFMGIVNNAKQADQDLYAAGTLEHTSRGDWHNLLRYGISRKREQQTSFSQAGNPITATFFGYNDLYYVGNTMTIRGGNGYTAIGRAYMGEEGSTFPYSTYQDNNRDELQYQTDYRFGQHFAAFGGFQFENERGSYRYPQYGIADVPAARTNYVYSAQMVGDVKNRVFYSLGTGVVKNHVFGVKPTPRAGLAWYPRRPGTGLFHGTKVRFNFSKAVQEADLFSEVDSLFTQVQQYGTPSDIAKYGLKPVGAGTTRSYEGGVDQDIWKQSVMMKLTYFHNEYTNQLEFVPASALGGAPFNFAPSVVTALYSSYVGGAYVNTLAYRAEGFETELDLQAMSNLYVRVGYTYLATKVKNSFASSALAPTSNPYLKDKFGVPIPIGASSPLKGGRMFRRPPHTAFVNIQYTDKKYTGGRTELGLTGALSGQSDDSTFLANEGLFGSSLTGDNSLLLPNRNLDYGYFKVDGSLVFRMSPQLDVYAQLDNILNNQHIGPIGFPALPFSVRAGVKYRLGGNR
ncbi:MAG: TonB-dependent receptor [Acidobacteriaceae bacterium]|nr:TonB-dependent receptor [Acidobacteriaceae bacterium]